MLSDFRGRQFTNSCKFIYRGFRDPQESGHIHHGQNLAVCREIIFRTGRCHCSRGIIHGDHIIGIAMGKLEC